MSNSPYLNNTLNEIDWDFTSFGNAGLNSFHWYPATFISAIPGSIIPLLTKPTEVVFDTFCGTSVTGFEAVRLGRKFIGVDNNPIAILISKAKLLFPETKALLSVFSDLSLLNLSKVEQHPNEAILKQWYHGDTFRELNLILSIIIKIENPTLKIPCIAVFSSILKNTSSQGKHWGWVCDNVIPKPSEIVYKNAVDIFLRALKNYGTAVEGALIEMKNRDQESRRMHLRQMWDIGCGDTISKMKTVEEDTIDLILTSPPYNGVADYVKAQRLSFLWFHEDVISIEGFSFKDFESLRLRETGARSFRHRKNSFDSYIQYMRSYILECQRILKPNGRLVLIMGDSRSREKTINPIEDFAVEKGFSKEFAFEREIKNTKRRLMAKVKNEQIKVFKKNIE